MSERPSDFYGINPVRSSTLPYSFTAGRGTLCVLFEAGDFLVQHFHVLAEFVDLAGEVVVVLTAAVAGAMLLFHTFDEFPYVTGFFGESGKGEMFACFP